MQTVWQEDGKQQRTVAPVSLVDHRHSRASTDVRRTLTPQLRLDRGNSELWLIDLGAGKQSPRRFGAGAGVQS